MFSKEEGKKEQRVQNKIDNAAKDEGTLEVIRLILREELAKNIDNAKKIDPPPLRP